MPDNPLRKVSAVETVLRALFQGHTVKLGNSTYAATEDNEIGEVEGDNIRVFTDRDLAIGLNAFIKLCDTMSDADLVSLRADVALTKLRREEAKRRG